MGSELIAPLWKAVLLISPPCSSSAFHLGVSFLPPNLTLQGFQQWEPPPPRGLQDTCDGLKQKPISFLGGSDSKESACSAGDTGSIPGLGRSPGGWHGNPLQYFFFNLFFIEV